MILYLKDLYDKATKWEQENIDSSTVKEKTKELEEKLTLLKKENEELQSELDSMEGAYKALVDLMEKARQMVVFKDEDKLPKG